MVYGFMTCATRTPAVDYSSARGCRWSESCLATTMFTRLPGTPILQTPPLESAANRIARRIA